MCEVQEKKKAELNLFLLTKTIFKRWKWLLLTVLIGAILGGAVGFFTTFRKKVYGTELQFQAYQVTIEQTNATVKVNAYKRYDESTMSDLLAFLNTRTFLEKLYCDEYGVPVAQEDMAEELKTAIATAKEQGKTLQDKNTEIKALEKDLTTEEALTKSKKDLYTIEEQAFEALTAAYEIAAKAGTLTSEQEAEYMAQKTVFLSAYNEYTAQQKKQAVVQDRLAALKEERLQANAQANESRAKAISLWRAEPSYKALFGKIDEEEMTVEFARPTGNASLSTIIAKIEVLDDLKVAQEIAALIEARLPSFVKEWIGDESAHCEYLPSDAVSQTNADETLSTSVKDAILGAIIALLVACVTIAIVDREKCLVRGEAYEQK